jgi:hypothetical protein
MAGHNGQLAAERIEGIPIAGRRSVRGESQLLPDAIEGESAPDLEGKHLALLVRKAAKCGLDGNAAVLPLKGSLENPPRLIGRALGLGFTDLAPPVTPRKVDCGPPDRREKEAERLAAELPLIPPIADESLLHDVLGIGERPSALAGIQQQSRAVALKPFSPALMIGGFLHANRGGC